MQVVRVKLNPGIPSSKAAFNKKKALFTSKLDINFRKKLFMCYIWSTALYGAENWTLRKIDQKYQASFETWCWRRMKKTIWTDSVSNGVLRRVKEVRNILTLKGKKANRIGQIMLWNCFLKHVSEGKIEGMIKVTGRRGWGGNQLLDGIKETRDC